MIPLATFFDQQIDGQCRAAGRKIRKRIVLAVDNFNILLAEGIDANPFTGKKFFARLNQLAKVLPEFGLDEESCRHLTIEAFAKLTDEELPNMAWDEIDKKFKIGQRRDNSGVLCLIDLLKEKGFKDSDE